jgi:hypothetical protein
VRFLMQYHPVNPLTAPPSPEMMAKMGAFVQASVESGVLIATGMVMPSALNGVRMTLADGLFDVQAGPAAHARQGGWAILNVESVDHLKKVARQFLEIAGDGDIKVLEIAQMPLPTT